ncbi:hypothetical protein [Facklamia sp. 7083-14-GEN3]|nr:hypothetical protein [Facklamia sp. 7083-14-GEN3]MCR8969294.1 hypothetical protein [Facklamia sp. 7083-14-GEN3]
MKKESNDKNFISEVKKYNEDLSNLSKAFGTNKSLKGENVNGN